MTKHRFFIPLAFAAILLGVCCVTFVVGFAADLFTRKKEAPVQPATYPRLAQELQGQVHEAMSPIFPFTFEQPEEPFTDKTGLSLTAPGAAKTPSNIEALRSGLAAPPLALPRSFPTSGPSFAAPVTPPPTLAPPPTPTPTPKVDVKQLLAERQRQIRQGEKVGPLAALYSVEEVRPIGIIGSGSRNRVWLYDPDTNQRFTVQRGEAFRDGTLEAVNSEGVVFRHSNGKISTARWMKNSEMPTDTAAADAPLLRVQAPAQTGRGETRQSNPDESAAKLPAPSPTPNPNQ